MALIKRPKRVAYVFLSRFVNVLCLVKCPFHDFYTYGLFNDAERM